MKLLKFKCNKSIFGVFTDIFVILSPKYKY